MSDENPTDTDGPTIPIMPYARHGREASRLVAKIGEKFTQPLDKLIVTEAFVAGMVASVSLILYQGIGEAKTLTELQKDILTALTVGVNRRLTTFNLAITTMEKDGANSEQKIPS